MRFSLRVQTRVERIRQTESRVFVLMPQRCLVAAESWWRHHMETFSALLALCAGNSPVTGEFLSQRPVTRSFDIFFHLCLNKRLSKQSWGRWFDTPSRSLRRHCNDIDQDIQTDAPDWLLTIAAAAACWHTGPRTETISTNLMCYLLISP